LQRPDVEVVEPVLAVVEVVAVVAVVLPEVEAVVLPEVEVVVLPAVVWLVEEVLTVVAVVEEVDEEVVFPVLPAVVDVAEAEAVVLLFSFWSVNAVGSFLTHERTVRMAMAPPRPRIVHFLSIVLIFGA
jgi:hypothetical protein